MTFDRIYDLVITAWGFAREVSVLGYLIPTVAWGLRVVKNGLVEFDMLLLRVHVLLATYLHISEIPLVNFLIEVHLYVAGLCSWKSLKLLESNWRTPQTRKLYDDYWKYDDYDYDDN